MSRVDKIFQENLSLIMAQPWEEVKRPVYNDGTGVKVKRILQVCNQYDLRREFPLGSIRPVNLKGAIKEILGIYQKGSTKIKDIGNIWNPWSTMKTSDRLVIYQRSSDHLVAGLWNVAQYAALMMMFAHDAGLKPAIFTHFIQDCHVYDRHEKQAEELLKRPLFGPIPQVTISSRMEEKGFYDFTPDDFEVWNYEPQPQIKFEVAK